MSGKKTFLVMLCLAVTWSGHLAGAEQVPQTPQARLVLFAQCAGRFSAEMEHDWLMGRDGAVTLEGRRQMVDLIEAIGPQPGLAGRDLLALRIESKMAHAALLSRATFGQEPRAWALARHFIDRCAALLPTPRDLAALR